MNQNNPFEDGQIKKLFFGNCVLIFLLTFAFVIHRDWALIFEKDLHFHDESVNSVVAANLTEKIWPTVVRINPLIEQQGIWMEGPNWQHIPPLFAYVPLPLFKIDGHISIEIERLSYALIILFGGVIFILSVAKFEKKIIATVAATIAAIFWIITPFTQGLITAANFGTSDIVLAFVVICCFASICWYLKYPSEIRKQYNWWKLALTAVVVTLPILTKNVLGLIPAATFFLLLLFDQKKINTKFLVSLMSFLTIIILYFGALYISSPIAFRKEIFVSFHHTTGDFEGWERPWYTFLTHYIPVAYTRKCTFIYGLSIVVGLYFLYRNWFTRKTKAIFERRTKVILSLSIGWFIWNLLIVSLVKSKAPNFIFQSYLFSLFFGVYTILLLFSKTQLYSKCKNIINSFRKHNSLFPYQVSILIFMALLGLSIYSYEYLIVQIPKTRSLPYVYSSEREKYYQFGEAIQKIGVNANDIFILNSTKDDCWFRYYILFLTGSEARTLEELLSYKTPVNIIQQKYRDLYFVVGKSNNLPAINIPHAVEYIGNFQVLIFNTNSLNQDYINILKSSILNSSDYKIFPAKISCSWCDLK